MSDLKAIDGLIADLGADLEPVRRLPAPAVRATLWIGVLVVTGAVMAAFADLPAIAHRLMGAPDMWLAVLGSASTAILGGIALFQLSVPDRHPVWALLPVPSLVLWLGASGLGCLRTWLIPEMHDATMGETRVCFTFIVSVSIPLSILTALMVRRAYPLRPNMTAAVAGLAVAAAAATLLNFFHPYDASATDLAVHLVAVVIVVGLNQLVAGRLWAKRSLRFHRRNAPGITVE